MSDLVIDVRNVSKAYRIWESPSARFSSPVMESLARVTPRGEWLKERAKHKYRDFHALRNISFEVRQGRSVGIIGRNGSGKSTLLQIIAGTLQPTGGKASVKGRVAALLELGSGFNPEFTGRENVFLYATILGLPRETIEQRFEAVANFADIGEFIDEPVKTYSSGMALRLAFAVIAHIDAKILIIDEALSVGDVYFAQKCMRFLKDFKAHGTLLFVSHDTSAVRALCDSAVWLDGGSMKMHGSAQDVVAAYLAEFNLSQKNHSVVETVPSPVNNGASASGRQIPADDQVFLAPKNPMTVSPFNPASPSYGDERVRVTNVHFTAADGVPVTTIHGGEVTCLTITGIGIKPTRNILFGFNFKDRLGQYLFGENTFQSLHATNVGIEPGEVYSATFTFRMPYLHSGQYTVAAAVASGTPENHRQQHWLHEALIVSSALNWAHAGLIGLPMMNIEVKSVQKPAALAL